MYYCGMKIYVLGNLPIPELLFALVSFGDTNDYKHALYEFEGRVSYCRKIYSNFEFNAEMIMKYNSEMLTPIKEV